MSFVEQRLILNNFNSKMVRLEDVWVNNKEYECEISIPKWYD